MIIAILLVGAGLIVKTADHVPNLDVKSTCTAAIKMMGATGRTVENCLEGETQGAQGSRKGLVEAPEQRT